jgi:hypothetical protein
MPQGNSSIVWGQRGLRDELGGGKDRRTHWEVVYRGFSPTAVNWYQSEPLISLDLVEQLKVQKDAAIVDVGGGASTFGCAV